VELGFVYWIFDCDEIGFSCPDRCTYELDLAGTYQYEVKVKTEGDDKDATEAPIYIQIIGSLGKTDVKMLSETGFQKDSSEDIVV